MPEGAAKLALRAEALELLLSGIDLKAARLRQWYVEPVVAAREGARMRVPAEASSAG